MRFVAARHDQRELIAVCLSGVYQRMDRFMSCERAFAAAHQVQLDGRCRIADPSHCARSISLVNRRTPHTVCLMVCVCVMWGCKLTVNRRADRWRHSRWRLWDATLIRRDISLMSYQASSSCSSRLAPPADWTLNYSSHAVSQLQNLTHRKFHFLDKCTRT